MVAPRIKGMKMSRAFLSTSSTSGQHKDEKMQRLTGCVSSMFTLLSIKYLLQSQVRKVIPPKLLVLEQQGASLFEEQWTVGTIIFT